MALEEPTQVRYVNRVDLTGVRDAGICAVILLAVSLGWNYTKRVNGPLLIIARDGTTKRLPTDTSIRMSVFQTALSTVMVHTEPDLEPTIELIDQIIAITGPSKDHERRLRLAVGETVAQHRDRIAALEAEPKGTREPQPVTQRIELPEIIPEYEPPAIEGRAEVIHGAYVPADNEGHGGLVSRQPFMARHQSSGGGTVRKYQSDSSLERVWEDGYVDYECVICGRAFKQPKGVGSHRQFHMQSGEIPRAEVAAYKRTGIIVEAEDTGPVVHRRTKAELAAAADIEFVDDLPPEPAPYEPPAVERPEPQWGTDALTYAEIVTQIAELILPMHTKRYKDQLAEKDAEIGRLNEALDKIQKDWNALKELLSGR